LAKYGVSQNRSTVHEPDQDLEPEMEMDFA
jgi:hypothetical protein